MKRNEEKPMSKTTAYILAGILVIGMCLGMVMGNKKSPKVVKKAEPAMQLKQQNQVER